MRPELSIWILPLCLLVACAPLKQADKFMTERTRQKGFAPDPVMKPETQKAAPAPEAPAVSGEAVKNYFAGLKDGQAPGEPRPEALRRDGQTFDPARIAVTVNGVLITSDAPEVVIAPSAEISVAVLNGGPVSLTNAEIGFYVPGAKHEPSEFWNLDGDGLRYWCRAPVNPASVMEEPFSFFTTAGNFKLKLPKGRHPAQVRIKSLDRPEIIRRFTLVVR